MNRVKELFLWINARQQSRIASYRWVYYGEDRLTTAMEEGDRSARKNIRLGILGLAALMVLLSVLSAVEPALEELERPAYGEGLRSEALQAEAVLGGERIVIPITLDISEEPLTAETAALLFAEAEQEIRTNALGENPSWDEVSSDLQLPLTAAGGRVHISWSSLDPLLVSEEGRVFLSSCREESKAVLHAVLWAESRSHEVDFSLTISPSEAGSKAVLASAVQKAAEKIAKEKTGPVVLPSEMDRISLQWKKQANVSFGAIFFMGVLILSFLWLGRYDRLRDGLKKEAALLDSELSDVMTKLILLLDAGLVSSAAFYRLAEEDRKDEGPLFRALWTIRQQCKEGNAAFPAAFYAFAVSSSSRELIRFAALIRENADHGSEFAEKLRKESSRLRESHLSAAKARARETETRLCIPLLLLLLSLLAIAAGPVFLEM